MIRCGELCKSCGSMCGKDFEEGQIQIGCPICGETGIGVRREDGTFDPCEHCSDGYMAIPGCPRTYVGGDMVEAINLAGMCGKGDWPVAGGLLDQSAWFMDLKQTLDSETSKIEAEQMKRGS